MKPFIPGQTFKDNKYYVFDKHGVTVMKPWPLMTAYRKTKTKSWQAVRPKFSFGENDIPNETNRLHCHRCLLNGLFEQAYEHECQPHPLLRYLEPVPDHLLELIKGVNSRQWHLLALFARCGEKAIELYKSTPALAWMLASSWAFKAKPVKNHFRSIRGLFKSGKSQREILNWLDFPSSKQTIKLLRKVDMSDVDITFFLHLKSVITRQTSLENLRHLRRIDYSVVRLLANHPHQFTFAFLCRFQQLERKQHRHIKDTLKHVLSDCQITKTIDVKELNLILAMATLPEDNVTLKYRSQHRVFPWPKFKLPENFPEIEYLDTEDELFNTAEAMHNCLNSHADNAYLNTVNFFRVNYYEQVVFSVTEASECSVWSINEIKGVCNKEPTNEALRRVEEWVTEANRLNPEMFIEIHI